MLIDLVDATMLSDDHAALYERLDRELADVARNGFGARDLVVPTVIPHDDMRTMKYHETFAGHYTRVTAEASRADAALVPAVCLLFYPQAHRLLAGDTEAAFTFRGRAFRAEEGTRLQGTRTWEFTVREVIFVGPPETVAQQLKTYQEEVARVLTAHGLELEARQAADYFTGDTPEINAMRRVQVATGAKRELVTQVEGREVAVASFNRHGTHFSAMYGWDADGTVVTGCAGVGLERAVWTISPTARG